MAKYLICLEVEADSKAEANKNAQDILGAATGTGILFSLVDTFNDYSVETDNEGQYVIYTGNYS